MIANAREVTLGIGERIDSRYVQVVGGLEIGVEHKLSGSGAEDRIDIEETGDLIAMIAGLEVFVAIPQATVVFAIVALAKLTAVYVGGIRQFFAVEHVIGRKARAELEVDVLVDLIIELQIAIFVVLIMSPQPLIRHEIGVVIAVVLFVQLLYTLVPRLPVVPHGLHGPVRTAP